MLSLWYYETDFNTVLVALLAFVNLVPAALSLEAARNLLVRLKLSHVLPNVMRWVDIIWLYIMSPLALLGLVFGSLAGGNAAHFRTVHGVSSLHYHFCCTTNRTFTYTRIRHSVSLRSSSLFSPLYLISSPRKQLPGRWGEPQSFPWPHSRSFTRSQFAPSRSKPYLLSSYPLQYQAFQT